MDAKMRKRRELEMDLRAALTNDEFELFYQPLVDVAQSKVVGFEALVRWHHPTRGVVSPATFIPLAEEAGLILSIGEWVLRTACLEAAKWPEHIRVAVNLSPIQFVEPTLPATIVSAIANADIQPRQLELEITEGVFLAENDATDDMFAKLKNIGVRLALDDFGTGYSSLAYLQQLPLDELKIDRSFIGALQATIADPLASFVIDVGRRLGMTTIAEGVETAEQEAVLRELGCDLMQGYFICRPLAADDFRQWVGQRAAAPAVDVAPAGA
jgi:EAL domain-containing protein (putative c-di-GMP-specific phosphodiesterase class I)